jgi:peptidoglycan/LPS O-acetylase OafA/YrhL
MGVLFLTVLIAWLFYEFVAQVIAKVKAKKMNEAYKKLRDIAEGRKPDDE